jgi:hypothetical protein
VRAWETALRIRNTKAGSGVLHCPAQTHAASGEDVLALGGALLDSDAVAKASGRDERDHAGVLARSTSALGAGREGNRQLLRPSVAWGLDSVVSIRGYEVYRCKEYVRHCRSW